MSKSTPHASGTASDFDLIIIGSGPAGQKAALQGAKAGKRIAIIERLPDLGGGCVHFGTLPSKSFRESVYRWSLGSRGTLGQEMEHLSGGPKLKKDAIPDMMRLLRRRDRVVDSESQVVQDQFQRNDIHTFHGLARFVSKTEVEVAEGPNGEGKKVRLKAPYIIIAVGARPVSPEHLTTDGTHVVDSNSILGLKEIPRAMAVLGGGIIGCEYASMFVMAGTKVHLVDRRHEVLANVDREIVNHMVDRFTQQGLELHLSCEATKLEKLGEKDGVRVHLSNGKTLDVNVVLVSLGRHGNTDDLGLENVGIQADERGLLKVDGCYRTAVPNIYAVGDVIGAPALASTSMEQGRAACSHAFKLEECTTEPVFPYGIYTIPEVSTLGPTEEELKAKKVDYVVGRARYREIARGQIVGDQWGLLKLLVDRKTLKLLGAHIIGDNAAELVHVAQAVMVLGGDLNYFIRTVFNYPTLAEAYKTAAFNAINQIKGLRARTK